MCNFIKDDNTTYMYYETKPMRDYCHGIHISTHNTITSYNHSTILFHYHLPVLLGCVVLVATVMVTLMAGMKWEPDKWVT